MKTLKLLFVVALMGCFSLISSAQMNKTVTCTTSTWESVYLPCLEEGLSGSVEICITNWNNKEQIKVKGTLVGDDTGTTYTLAGVGNWMIRPMMDGNAENQTQVQTLTVCLDGMPVFTMHALNRYTINANGETVVEIANYYIECN